MTFRKFVAVLVACLATTSGLFAQDGNGLRGDDWPQIRYGAIEGIPNRQALEFVGPDGEARGWILLNARSEPVIWATTQYQYVFGPLKRFGNLQVPDWATTSKGLVRYEMISLQGSAERPDLELFAPPTTMTGQ